jgi:alkyldihydroxyacetonephosphate synthase
VRIPAGRLREADLALLRDVVGPAWVHTDHRHRVARAAGRSYPDLIRLRRGEVAAPDAVVLPGDADEVAALLERCSRADLAVVPVGGGTSVVGGIDPLPGDHRAVIALDLRRLDRLLDLDPVAQVARFQAGIRGAAA